MQLACNTFQCLTCFFDCLLQTTDQSVVDLAHFVAEFLAQPGHIAAVFDFTGETAESTYQIGLNKVQLWQLIFSDLTGEADSELEHTQTFWV